MRQRRSAALQRRGWHVICEQAGRIASMASKMKMLKLLQEMRWLAQITSKRSQPGPIGPLLLAARPVSRASLAARRKRTIRVTMHDPPDIPTPVKITHVNGHQRTPLGQAANAG